MLLCMSNHCSALTDYWLLGPYMKRTLHNRNNQNYKGRRNFGDNRNRDDRRSFRNIDRSYDRDRNRNRDVKG